MKKMMRFYNVCFYLLFAINVFMRNDQQNVRMNILEILNEIRQKLLLDMIIIDMS